MRKLHRESDIADSYKTSFLEIRGCARRPLSNVPDPGLYALRMLKALA